LAAPAADLEAGEELERLGDAEAADLGQRLVGDEDVARRGVQTRAAAARAGLHALILRELLADGVRLGLLVAPLHVRDHAFEAMPAAVLAAALVLVSEDDLLAAAAFEQHLADGLRQRLERLLDVEAVVLRERRDHLEVIRVAAVPAPDRAGRERQARVAHDAVEVEEAPHTEAVAVGARADRVVEREETRLELGDAGAAERARELVREDQRRAVVVEERDLRDA